MMRIIWTTVKGHDMKTEQNRREQRFERNARIRQRRKYYYGMSSQWYDSYPDHADKIKGMHYQTGTLCSCAMCGNPRKFFGAVTLKEQSHSALWKTEDDQ